MSKRILALEHKISGAYRVLGISEASPEKVKCGPKRLRLLGGPWDLVTT